MPIDEKTVQHVAKLAHIALSPEESAAFLGELQQTLRWVEGLPQVDEAVEPMITPSQQPLEWREDMITVDDLQKTLMASAPEAAHGFYTVPKVVE